MGLVEAVLGLHTTALSGGQLARLAVASVLLARFDVLLLDEPTNDLDLDGVEVLERHLMQPASGLVVVSHDRAFLDRVVTDIAEIDEFSHEVRVFGGGWTAYEEERALARRRASEDYEAYENRRAHLVAQARRQREWARSGAAAAARSVRAGRSGERDKFVRQSRKQGAQARAAAAARIERALERLDPVPSPREPWQLRLRLEASARSGD